VSELELHPLNRGFEWRRAAESPAHLSERQARSFDEQGFFLLENALAREEVQEIAAEIDPVEEDFAALLRERGGKLFIADADEITFTAHLVKRSARIREFCRGRVFRHLCADLIGPNVRLYWDQAVYKKPEPERVFPWHQDNGYNFVEPQQYLTCWIPLTDATLENGCPWVVPGLHLRGTLKHELTETGWRCLEDPRGAVPVPARAGDVVVFSSLTPHLTGPNRTDRVRKTYILQYAPDAAVTVKQDEATGRRVEVLQNDPERQFEILSGGAPARVAQAG